MAGKLERIVEGMEPELRDFYLAQVERVHRAIRDYYPRAMSVEQLADVTALEPMFEPDLAAISESVLQPAQDYLDRGGKMLRPVLVALVLEAYGEDPARYAPLLGAIELMEDSSIMMDDYIDHSELRRGGPCAHVAHGHATANLSSCTV